MVETGHIGRMEFITKNRVARFFVAYSTKIRIVFPVNCVDFPCLMVSVAQGRTLHDVLRSIVTGIAACQNVALARIWLVGPSDLCPTCRLHEESPEQSQCL